MNVLHEVLFVLCIFLGVYQTHAASHAFHSDQHFRNLRDRSEQHCLRRSNIKVGNLIDPRSRVDLTKGCVLYYLHNHKSGGTTMCSTAKRGGFNVNIKENCNVPPTERRNAEAYISHHNLTFVAQENPYFQPNMSSNKYLYMTTIRNPLNRIISHLHHELCIRTVESAREYMAHHHCDVDIVSATLSDIILSDCFNKTLGFIASNYYINMFTGCKIRRMCDSSSLQEAIRKLDAMSVIVKTDTSVEYIKYSKLLDLKFSMGYRPSYRSGTHIDSDATKMLGGNHTAMQRLLAMNELDMEFYEVASRKAVENFEKDRDALVQMGKFSSSLQGRVKRRASSFGLSHPLARFHTGVVASPLAMPFCEKFVG